MTESDPLHALERQNTLAASQASLVEEFAGTFAPEAVARCLEDSYERLLPASIAAYLPLLAQRFARERLRAASRTTGSVGTHGRDAAGAGPAPLVLFVCTANSGRSQLAAALVAHRAGARVEVASAGTAPAAVVQSEVVLVLGELGIDAGEMFPKPLTDEVVAGADVVVTMGCGDTCPVLPGRRYLDWGVADPAGRGLDEVRRIRDDIHERVGALVDELLTVPSHLPARRRDSRALVDRWWERPVRPHDRTPCNNGVGHESGRKEPAPQYPPADESRCRPPCGHVFLPALAKSAEPRAASGATGRLHGAKPSTSPSLAGTWS